MREPAHIVGPVAGVDLASYFLHRGRLVDDALELCLPPATQHPAIIHEAMRYCVFAGGKRLRPILVLAGMEAGGGDVPRALPVACAVELIHTYSLIHDDLPAMDDSDTRRGRPTCHVVFGDAIAVLAGDALHALAFNVIAQMAETMGADRTVAVSREIAAAIGTEGMVGGQVLDLLGEGRQMRGRPSPVPPQPLTDAATQIHLRKTAALIRASIRSGALLAGTEAQVLAALTQYGERIGLAFQVVDDLLDVTGEEAKLGKHAHSDALRAKVTYPAAFGIERSRAIAAELTEEAIEALRPLGPAGVTLRDLARYLLTRES